MNVTPQARPRRVHPALIGVAAGLAVVALAVTGWALLAHRPVAAPAASPPASSASPASSAFSYGSSQAACQAVDRLVKAGTLDDMDQLRAWADTAANSSDSNIAIAARLLRQTADLAIAARGQADEATYTKKTGLHAVNLQQACIKAGYA